ncbi:hypothetical protein T10_6772 [Trichinella papuae]|uniref:Uncharacterized protein n=1 Tax=Trichinella papuae TaxID=268474 RepID=A0A0V1LW01_9BILA|nr:hypothetical protein T10_6772 [Trichinella papuae]
MSKHGKLDGVLYKNGLPEVLNTASPNFNAVHN